MRTVLVSYSRALARWVRAAAALLLLLVLVLLVGCRLAVYATNWMAFKPSEFWHYLLNYPIVVLGVGQCFVLSLCFELAALLLLCELSRLGRGPRWLARLGLLVLLFINLAGTVVFLVLKSYIRGFQLEGLTAFELRSVVLAQLGLARAALLLLAVLTALLFGRAGSLEARPPPPRTRLLLLLLFLATAAGTGRLIATPIGFPPQAHSPATLFLMAAVPDSVAQVPHGVPAPEDWAPVRELAPQWRDTALARTPRRFNIVLLVMESVRAASCWPSPEAPPMPRLRALGDRAAVFTRHYAHEPFSVKGLEAFTYAMYPRPTWEVLSDRHPPPSLESVPQRWQALGLRTAFIPNGILFDPGPLGKRGFGRVFAPEDLERIDRDYNDRTLVRALDGFIGERPQERFAAVLWTRHSHHPYQLPAPLPNPHPPWSYGAYQDTISFIDQMIGDLQDMLARRGLLDDTVLVLSADHGEVFDEHPEEGRAHGGGVYEHSSHIPLIFVNRRLFHGERDGRIVQQKDVGATLSWLAGSADPNFNSGAAVFFQKPSEVAYLIDNVEAGNARGGIVRGDLKYYFFAEFGDTHPADRLFDLGRDPGEDDSLWPRRPAEGRALKERYFGWLRLWRQRWQEVDLLRQPDRQRVMQVLFRR